MCDYITDHFKLYSFITLQHACTTKCELECIYATHKTEKLISNYLCCHVQPYGTFTGLFYKCLDKQRSSAESTDTFLMSFHREDHSSVLTVDRLHQWRGRKVITTKRDLGSNIILLNSTEELTVHVNAGKYLTEPPHYVNETLSCTEWFPKPIIFKTPTVLNRRLKAPSCAHQLALWSYE